MIVLKHIYDGRGKRKPILYYTCTLLKYVGGKKGTYIWETQSNQNLIKVQWSVYVSAAYAECNYIEINFWFSDLYS